MFSDLIDCKSLIKFLILSTLGSSAMIYLAFPNKIIVERKVATEVI